MSDLVGEARTLAEARDWQTRPILGHGLWARYQEALELVPALCDALEAAEQERNEAVRQLLEAQDGGLEGERDELREALRALVESVRLPEVSSAQYTAPLMTALAAARVLLQRENRARPVP